MEHSQRPHRSRLPACCMAALHGGVAPHDQGTRPVWPRKQYDWCKCLWQPHSWCCTRPPALPASRWSRQPTAQQAVLHVMLQICNLIIA